MKHKRLAPGSAFLAARGRASSRLVALILSCLAFVPLLSGCGRSSDEAAASAPAPTLAIADIRGGTGDTVSFPVAARHLPDGTVALEWVLDLRLESVDAISIRAGSALPNNSRVEAAREREGEPVFRFRVEAAEGETLARGGEMATLSFTAPGRITGRRPVALPEAWAVSAAGEPTPVEPDVQTVAVSLISDPILLFTFLAGCVALIFWLSTLKPLATFFRYFPPLIWTYFVPMISTTLGITPDASSLYGFMSRVLLPAVLVLLLIPSDVRGLVRLGWKAAFMMLSGTLGIVLGAIGSFALFATFFPTALPPESWKGIASLAGSWIGGSPNMVAVMESLGTPPSLVGPMVVVDTVLAYSWLGLLIALSAYQKAVDRRHGADSRVVDEISAHIAAEHEAHARDPKVVDVALMIGLAFAVSQICLFLGKPINAFVVETLQWKALGEVINAFGWGILTITAAGLILSTTRLRRLDYCGASSLGYVGLYLLLTSYGARANLKAVLEVPVFFGIGFVWLVIHIAVLYTALRLFRAPLFLGATSSMANIGGTASAPVVAAAYNQSMAPVGLLMAILGGVIGTPISLFVVATICRAIAGG